MTSRRQLRLLILSGLALLVVAFLVFHFEARLRGAASAAPLPVLGQVSGFQLTNQSGLPVNGGELRGRIWVGDIIFTRCPGPCVRMSTALSRLQSALPATGGIRLVSLTADPDHDTPTVLGEYARRFSADTNRWQFLTGSKKELYRLAIDDLLLAVGENPLGTNAPPEDLFIHSTRLVLVDGVGRVRGTFDGEDAEVVPRVVRATEALLAESRSKP